jgi:hypothetical protein
MAISVRGLFIPGIRELSWKFGAMTASCPHHHRDRGVSDTFGSREILLPACNQEY